MSIIPGYHNRQIDCAIECDNCQMRTKPVGGIFGISLDEKAYEEARLKGWLIALDGDYCPNCQKYLDFQLTGTRT